MNYINHSFTYTKEDQTYLLIEPDDQISNRRYINADVINAILIYENKEPVLEYHIKNYINSISRGRTQQRFYSNNGYYFEARYYLDQMYFSIVLDD